METIRECFFVFSTKQGWEKDGELSATILLTSIPEMECGARQADPGEAAKRSSFEPFMYRTKLFLDSNMH